MFRRYCFHMLKRSKMNYVYWECILAKKVKKRKES